MTHRPHKHEHHHEDPFPVKTRVQELIKHESCPDPLARVTGKPNEKQLPPGSSFYRVSRLIGGTTEEIIGVKITHRRPTGLQEVHVHTNKPAEMLAFLATALIG